MKTAILLFVLLTTLSIGLKAQDLNALSLSEIENTLADFENKGNYDKMVEYALAGATKAAALYGKEDTAYANMLFYVGFGYLNDQDMTRAEKYLKQALDIQKARPIQSTKYGHTLIILALLYHYSGNYVLAEPLYKEIIPLQKETLGKKHPDYIEALNSLAELYLAMNNITSALPLYEEITQIKKEILGTKHPDYATCLSILGKLYADIGNYSLAESLYKEALEIRKKVLDKKHPDYATSISNLGKLYIDIGNYSLAEPLCKEALQIRKEILGEKDPDYATSLNNLAGLYFTVGNYTPAESLYKESLQIKKEVLGKKDPHYATGLNNLADLYNEIGNYTLAKSLHQEALQIRQEVLGEKHPDYAVSLSNLAQVYSNIDSFALAETLYKKAINIQKEVLGEKHPSYAISLNNLANLYTSMHNYVLAETLYKEAINIQKEILGEKHQTYTNSLNNLAALYYEAGNYSLAIPLCKKVISIQKEILSKKHPDYINSLYSLAMMYYMVNSYDTAQYYFKQFLPLSLDYINKQGSSLGEKAKQALFQTLEPHINNVNSFAAFYRQQDSLLIDIQNGLLLTKGYALAGVSELLPLIKSLHDDNLTLAYHKWNATKVLLGKAYQMSIEEREKQQINIDSLEHQMLEQESELMQSSLVLKERLGYNKKRFYYNDLVTNIAKEEVAIDFVRFEATQDTIWYYALISQQGQAFPKYIPICKESQLSRYANAEINPNKESYITLSSKNKALYQLIISPLEPYLTNKKSIHWALVGLLNQIAMGTLKDDSDKMLLERFAIHQYGALKDFIVKKQADGNTGSTDKSLLLVGNIAFDLDETEHINLAQNTKMEEDAYVSRAAASDNTRSASRFSRLAGTKVEVEHLYKAFASKKWTINALQQKEAIEEQVKVYCGDKTPLVLHFATHGFFIPAPKAGYDNPLLRSGIALAGANRVWMGKPALAGVEDGLWTAYEIANTNLMNATLVVLSACETAKGQIDPHEGVLGLQRAFKIAGVDNMLLSLWQVPDKETVELMQAFYKYYLSGNTPSEALAKAQETMRKVHPEPYYWAAFILIE